jgi:hypothetical protein
MTGLPVKLAGDSSAAIHQPCASGRARSPASTSRRRRGGARRCTSEARRIAANFAKLPSILAFRASTLSTKSIFTCRIRRAV